MRELVRRLRQDDDGAVTVDWVVLTAVMAGFGAAIAFGISQAATEPADSVGNFLSDRQVRD